MAAVCDICRSIFQQRYDSEGTFYHRKIRDLVQGSHNDCMLCRVLWSKLSSEEKLLLSVNLEQQHLSKNSRISYIFDRSWNSAVGVNFKFPDTSEIPGKTVLFQKLPKCGSESISSLESEDSTRPSIKITTTSALAKEDSSTGSTSSLERAKAWVTTCGRDHSICKPRFGSTMDKLPARLVWIKPSEEYYLQLRDTHHLPRNTQYMTLSHCWGTLKFLTLTINNLDDFRARIPFENLTKTFQDAINITRYMDIEYIWIDSLCILQDSIVDWRKESLLMKEVYSNSYCNIAASYASNGELGCFVDRTIEAPLTLDVLSLGGYPFERGRYRFYDAELWSHEVDESLLLQRAWVFQERMLSPRTLHFTSSQIFFECGQSHACESYPEDMLVRLDLEGWADLGDGYKARIMSMLSDARNDHRYHSGEKIALMIWLFLVNSFAACKLTFEGDRLIAISGLAQLLEPLIQCRYLAGLWEYDLVPQLVWRSDGITTRSEAYHAPSWSWASISGRTISYHPEMRRVAGMRDSFIHHWEYVTARVTVCDIEIATTDGNPMSKVTCGRLLLKGSIFPVDVTFVSQPATKDERLSMSAGYDGLVLVPDIAGDILSGRYFCVMCLDRESEISGAMGHVFRYSEGLLLRPTGKAKGEFSRVGLVASIDAFSRDNDPVMSIRNVGVNPADEFYEMHDAETHQYVFSIV